MSMRLLIPLALLLLSSVAAAQLLQSGPIVPPVIGGAVEDVGATADGVVGSTARQASRILESARLTRLDRLVSANRGAIEFDDVGQPARRGEVLLLDDGLADLAAAQSAGFVLLGRETIDGLDLTVTRLRAPRSMNLRNAIRRLREIMPRHDITADQLFLVSGQRSAGQVFHPRAVLSVPSTDVAVGIIDSGVATSIVQPIAQRGFASGAPLAADHGTAVGDLLRHAGVERIHVADVYGSDPAGGSTLALVRSLAWMVTAQVRIVSISLVGRDNPLLRRAIVQAQARGVILVAAVGNDGPAAPQAYPASYRGVIAVTGVDRRNRALIEAGRAAHLDYAAPGADMIAARADGRLVRVRGTSYAAPLVAARLAHALDGRTMAGALAWLDAEAVDLGQRGPDQLFGRGLLCGTCRRTR